MDEKTEIAVLKAKLLESERIRQFRKKWLTQKFPGIAMALQDATEANEKRYFNREGKREMDKPGERFFK